LLESYEDTVTPLKKSKSAEKYRPRPIKKHPIANLTLGKLKKRMFLPRFLNV
jgi:hypothetical protein